MSSWGPTKLRYFTFARLPRLSSRIVDTGGYESAMSSQTSDSSFSFVLLYYPTTDEEATANRADDRQWHLPNASLCFRADASDVYAAIEAQ